MTDDLIAFGALIGGLVAIGLAAHVLLSMRKS